VLLLGLACAHGAQYFFSQSDIYLPKKNSFHQQRQIRKNNGCTDSHFILFFFPAALGF
jgi:hypothetical protein